MIYGHFAVESDAPAAVLIVLKLRGQWGWREENTLLMQKLFRRAKFVSQ